MNFFDLLSSIFKPKVSTPKPVSSRTGQYDEMFSEIIIKKEWEDRVLLAAKKVLEGKLRYRKIAFQTDLPWHLVGCLHLMESGCDFSKQYHNGDSLRARTTHVPKGRPIIGNPPFTWEESAIDALNYDHILAPILSIGHELEVCEKFNGFGYRAKNINSPYIWSGSQYYQKGKYVADGRFDPTAVSGQVGIACVLHALKELNVLD